MYFILRPTGSFGKVLSKEVECDLHLRISLASRGRVNCGGARVELGRPVTFLCYANADMMVAL